MKKKLLYLMIIDWKWIFQRPQILSLLLEKDYEVTVIFPKIMEERKMTVEDSRMPAHFKEYPLLPFRDKLRPGRWIQKAILRKATGKIEKYDIVWIGYPTLFRIVPDAYKGLVVYDCMDNYSDMYPQGILKKSGLAFLQAQETKLLQRADIIFASSNILMEKIKDNSRAEPCLLRNGFINTAIYPPQKAAVKKNYRLGYIGTIAHWFDLDLLKASLNFLDNISYSLIGPKPPYAVFSKGIIYEGCVRHEQLYEKIESYDALLMPFVLNNIVLAVDPVKLYEYISYGKCIISIYYPEIERFRPFVHFYHNRAEYLELIKDLSAAGFPAKYDQTQQQKFLAENSWDVRYQRIKSKLEEINDEHQEQ